MKIKSLLLALFIGLTTVGFAQEKKTLDNLANDPNAADFKFETEEYNFGSIVQGESVT